DVRRRFDLEPVRRQPLDANRRPGSLRSGPEVLAHACDEVPPTVNRAPVEGVRLRLAEVAVFGFTFGSEPEAIDVLAYPTFVVPASCRDPVAHLPFELVEQHVVMHSIVMDRVLTIQFGKGRGAILIGDRWNSSRILFLL